MKPKNIVACNDPDEKRRDKENAWDRVVATLQTQKEYGFTLFTGRKNQRIIVDPDEAARELLKVLTKYDAPALLMDVKGDRSVKDFQHFWINVYESLLNIDQFKKVYAGKITVVFWSRFLNMRGLSGQSAQERISALGVPQDNILDFYTNGKVIDVVCRLLATDKASVKRLLKNYPTVEK